MGIADRKEREKQEMRALIKKVALEVFIKEGYERTSIRIIANKIEYSPATIYLYYKDKSELFYDVQKDACEALHAFFLKKITGRLAWRRLEQLCRAYIEFAVEHPDVYDLIFILDDPMDAIKDECWNNALAPFQVLIDCVNACMKEKLLRFKDPMVAALSIWAMGHGLVSLRIRRRFEITQLPEEKVNALIDAIVVEYLRLIKN
jgi:AcrR family transcriptional regulator